MIALYSQQADAQSYWTESNALQTGLDVNIYWTGPIVEPQGTLIDVEIYIHSDTYLSGVFNNQYSVTSWMGYPYATGSYGVNTVQWNVPAQGTAITWYCYVSVGMTWEDNTDPQNPVYHYRWQQILVGLEPGTEDTLWVLFPEDGWHS